MTRAAKGAAQVAPVRCTRCQTAPPSRQDGLCEACALNRTYDPPARRSRSQTAASRRAQGLVPVTVWLTGRQRDRLAWIRNEDGHDYATIIGCAIDQEWEERNSM